MIIRIINEKGQEGGRLVENGPELQVCRKILQFVQVLYIWAQVELNLSG